MSHTRKRIAPPAGLSQPRDPSKPPRPTNLGQDIQRAQPPRPPHPARPPQPAPAAAPEARPDKTTPGRPSALTIRDVLLPALMQSAACLLGDEIDIASFTAYRNALAIDSRTQDLLEQTLVEQVAMAHLASFQLQAKAGAAATPEAAGIYATAAARLMGETRRSIVALKEFRTPPTPASSITIAQQVHVAGDKATEAEEKVERPQSELGGNHGRNRLREVLGEGSGRPAERAFAGALD